jgi:hypothetical protein
MEGGFSVAFIADSDLVALTKFDQFVYQSQNLHVANYEVYAYFQEMPNDNENPWLTVFYVGMTSAPARRIQDAITREFPKLYAGKTIWRLVIKNSLTKGTAAALEASMQMCFG